MRAGHPLDDEDRWPWLRRPSAAWIGEHEQAGRSVVVTCSALKRTYRDLLGDGHPSVWFAHVTASPELIRDRLEHRTGHYMPASLLHSQLATLEPLQDDEPGARISGAGDGRRRADRLLAALDVMNATSIEVTEASVSDRPPAAADKAMPGTPSSSSPAILGIASSSLLITWPRSTRSWHSCWARLLLGIVAGAASATPSRASRRVSARPSAASAC